MVESTRLGIIYTYNENWIGGTYYIHNLLKALLHLPKDKRPSITVLAETKEEFEKLQADTKYPALTFFPLFSSSKYTLIEKVLNKLGSIFFNYRFFDRNRSVADIVFPVLTAKQEAYGKKKIFWIPDFQEHKLPHFFKAEELEARAIWQKHVSVQKNVLVLSSQDALNNYQLLEPQASTVNRVVPFATVQSTCSFLSLESLMVKYQLPANYFMSPNQFWAHKNHIILLQALQLLKEKGIAITVVFTGKEHDYRNPDYFASLQAFVAAQQLEPFVKFLGFIDRQDQLALMQYAKAIVQPSLCEGWSTVIEDAKSLGKKVIASNLAVHEEQLRERGSYFNPNNVDELAGILQTFHEQGTEQIDYHYQQQIEQFATNFISAIHS